jgi:glyoxylase-like metal-dependent hydrolase (beta-lactamase superfamily II)
MALRPGAKFIPSLLREIAFRALQNCVGAKAIATPKVTEMMRKQTSPQVMAGLWNKRFPGLIPKNIVFAEQLEGDTLHLEGHELVVVDVGHTDTDDSTCLYVPSVGLVVAGDLAYNDVHQYFAESLTHGKTHGMGCCAG